MTVQLNHTFVHASDGRGSAHWFAGVLGLGVDETGHFPTVRLANTVLLEFVQTTGVIAPQHYAFLVSDEEFDDIHARVTGLNRPYWAYPLHHGEGRFNDWAGGRGFYFDDPDGHSLEVMTRASAVPG